MGEKALQGKVKLPNMLHAKPAVNWFATVPRNMRRYVQQHDCNFAQAKIEAQLQHTTSMKVQSASKESALETKWRS